MIAYMCLLAGLLRAPASNGGLTLVTQSLSVILQSAPHSNYIHLIIHETQALRRAQTWRVDHRSGAEDAFTPDWTIIIGSFYTTQYYVITYGYSKKFSVLSGALNLVDPCVSSESQARDSRMTATAGVCQGLQLLMWR